MSDDTENSNFPNNAPPRKLVLLPFSKLSKALSLGFLANLGVSILLGLFASLILATYFAAQGLTADQIEAVTINLASNKWLLVVFTIFSLFASLLGGFVTGKLAKQQEILYASILAVIQLLMSLAVLMISTAASAPSSSEGALSPWLAMTLMFIDVWATVQGGKLAKKLRLNVVSK